MSEHPSFVVYEHLPRFFESRGLAPYPGGPALDAPRDRFVTELNHIGYFRADAEGADGRAVVILLLAPRGKYTDHGPQLRTLVASLDSEPLAKAGRLAEVMVIAPEEVLAKKNMTDIVVEFQKHTDGAGAAEHYNMYAYYVFSLDVPRAQAVPRHEVVPEEEVAAFLGRERLGLRDLKTMPISSPPVVWIGGRPGDVVRTIAASETAGEAYDYWLLGRG